MLILTDKQTADRPGDLPAVLGAAPWTDAKEADLSPDLGILCRRLLPAAEVRLARSSGGGFWTNLVIAGETSVSQYDVLREIIPTVERCGPTAALALAGSGFHGQQGRHWAALAGNLHLSLAIPCRLPARPFASVLNALPAMAVIDALADLGLHSPAPGIKWVNDILIKGRKVAGVLTSARSREGELQLVCLGIGLNVAAAPSLSGSDLSREAACLADFWPDRPLLLSAVLSAILQAVARRFAEWSAQGPAPLLDAYRRASLVVGKRVAVWPNDLDDSAPGFILPEPLHRGRVEAIADDLGLVLEGSGQAIHNGRLGFDQ